MGVDLHRIGTGISSGTSRNGFNSIVSFPSVAPSYPAYGSYNSTLYGVTYPIVNGGASVTVNSTAYPSQTCEVTVKNDGAGGTYTDWTTATDVQYIPNETSIVSITTNLFINVAGGDYDNGSSTEEFKHNGTGGYSSSVTYSYPADDTLIVAATSAYNVDMITNCNGTLSGTVGTITTNYYHDGGGGSDSTAPTTSYLSYRTLSTSEYCDDGSGNYQWTYYYSDGSGGYFADSTYP